MKNFIITASLLACFNVFAAAQKATICHSSGEGSFDIQVSINAIPAFERQGDFIGTCLYRDLLASCQNGVNETQDACKTVLIGTETVDEEGETGE